MLVFNIELGRETKTRRAAQVQVARETPRRASDGTSTDGCSQYLIPIPYDGLVLRILIYRIHACCLRRLAVYNALSILPTLIVIPWFP